MPGTSGGLAKLPQTSQHHLKESGVLSAGGGAGRGEEDERAAYPPQPQPPDERKGKNKEHLFALQQAGGL